ncbi:vesicular integral-membrane protein VIP36 [Condylostylus longicornis]|uniref:vesicular integral-membrane protein VIP36 n=1 Tax=Condylostylus longicornis TaxID=2530218 RepID=UPI00244E0926|nr:vesicular integral-membrane protein VIP36 [Condylostylus longicornis]
MIMKLPYKYFIKNIKMPKISSKYFIFCIILSFSYSISAMNSDDYFKREFSLIKPYLGGGLNLPYWDFLGHTMVTTNYIRLTPDLQSKSGAIWNTSPCMSRNWEIQVTFKVHGKGTELYGDGMAIWYAKDRMVPGDVFGSKDLFSGLAIILDTYSNHNGPHNHQHPYISGMVNNGSLSYDHDRDGTHTQIDGCEARFRNANYETHLSIRYENDVLHVSTDFENKNEWKNCFSVNGIELPTGYYFGVSATTGDLSDNHDLHSFKFYDLDTNFPYEKALERTKIIPKSATFEPPRERHEDPKPSMSNAKIFFLLLFGMLAAVAITVFIISYYREKNAKKRFY